MTPYYQDEAVTVHHGDCIEVLRRLPDNSVDSVVTDPPYGLEFMGKDWDGADGFRRSLNEADAGRESVFGRTSQKAPEYKTASKAAAGIMAGGTSPTNGRPSFLGGLNPKCRNCDKWQRGGSPCSCDAPDFTNERLPRLHAFQEWCEVWATECLRVLKPGGHMVAFGGSRTWHRLASAVEDAGFEIRDSIAWLYGSGFPKSRNLDGDHKGWGTALKPAFEPIVVGRKPLVGTVAANVLTHGTGALNIDASRIAYQSTADQASATPQGVATALVGALAGKVQSWESATTSATAPSTTAEMTQPSATSLVESAPNALGTQRTAFTPKQSDLGRWPTNVLLEGSQAESLDRQGGTLTSGTGAVKRSSSATRDGNTGAAYGAESRPEGTPMITYGDTGGASRFFPTFHYEAKAPTHERPNVDGVQHPTVKPLDLMRWLVRLVTPLGGTVLEPFAGSGTTAEACIVEGFKCIAIERDESYLPLILSRIQKPIEVSLFGNIA